MAKALLGLVGSCSPRRTEKKLSTGRDAAVQGLGMPSGDGSDVPRWVMGTPASPPSQWGPSDLRH